MHVIDDGLRMSVVYVIAAITTFPTSVEVPEDSVSHPSADVSSLLTEAGVTHGGQDTSWATKTLPSPLELPACCELWLNERSCGVQ